MKKQILTFGTLALAIALSQNVNAQSGWTPTSPSGVLTTNGNTTRVGIGTTTPADKLSVNGVIGYEAGNDLRFLKGRSNAGLWLYSTDEWTNGGSILLSGPNASFDEGSITMLSKGINTPNKLSFKLAATDGSAWYTRMYIDQLGNTVIGDLSTTNSSDKLSVMGDMAVYAYVDPVNGDVNYRKIKAYAPQAGLIVTSNSSWDDGASILMNGINGGSTSFDNGSMYLIANPDAGGSSGNICFSTKNGTGGWNTNMIINREGKVTIGNVPTTSNSYKLYVEGGILTEKVKVAINGSAEWSDYVFGDDYSLKSLDEVESFIKDNKHLPDVPSAETVATDGIDVGKMDATLLRKIEELTLYVIAQQKEINELKSKLNK